MRLMKIMRNFLIGIIKKNDNYKKLELSKASTINPLHPNLSDDEDLLPQQIPSLQHSPPSPHEAHLPPPPTKPFPL